MQSDQYLYFLLFESIVSKLATSESSFFWIVSVAEETGFSLTLSETPKTGFVAQRPFANRERKVFENLEHLQY